MLKRARITGYKSLWDAEITFADPLTLIIGPNAAGKTNLFDALALLSRIVTLGSVMYAFTVEHRGSPLEAFSFGEEGLSGNMKEGTREISFEIDIELSTTTVEAILAELDRVNPWTESYKGDILLARSFRYQLTLASHLNGKSVIVQREFLHVLNNSLEVERTFTLGFLNNKIGIISYTPDEDVSSVSFDLSTVIRHESFISSAPVELFPVVNAFKVELARWQFYDLDPKKMKEPGTYIETAILPTDGHDLASFFDTVKTRKPRQFGQMTRELSMIVPQIDEFDVTVNERAEVDLTVREQGARFSAKLLSEGTLRVLGLLAASSPLEPVSLIALEEPENGIHPRRLELVATHFRNLARWHKERQVLLTTHSPLLPEYLNPEQVVVCQRRGNRTTFKPLREAGLIGLEEPITVPEDAIVPTPLSERILRGYYGG